MNGPLRSPLTGTPLVAESGFALRDDAGVRWPVIDGIPFLRVGREALAGEAVARMAAGDREGALVLLLADQDDWWNGPPTDPDALRRLVREQGHLSLRDAMACLAFGRVGDYFAHRWCDPTYLAGLALLEAHWRPARTAFELACGIGHYGRELMARGVAFTGGDVVFSKLWLARHWVLPPEATLVCFDAAAPWPLAEERFDLVFCHDAFYFLEPKDRILAQLRAMTGATGRLAISHIHNSGADNLSAGRCMDATAIAGMFSSAAVYDDSELTQALVESRPPVRHEPHELAGVEAFSIEDRVDGSPARPVSGGLALPASSAALKLNPLYLADDGNRYAVSWPSPRYQAEYAPRATFPLALPSDGVEPTPDAVRRRVLVDLPERW